MANNELSPIHPGEVLLEEFLSPSAISTAQLAEKMAVPVSDIDMLIQGRHTITADIAVKLSKAWGTSAEFWLNLQRSYDGQLERWQQRTGNS